MATNSKFHQKPFTLIGSFVFLLVGILHALRVVYGAPIVIADVAIPMWPSYAGTVAGIVLAIMLWRENLR